MSAPGMDFDELLPLVGELGRYQKWLLVLVTSPACAAASISLYSHIFVSAVPDHYCKALVSAEKAYLLNRSLVTTEGYQEALKSLLIPRDAGGNFVHCQQFDVNLDSVIDELIEGNQYVNSTVLDTFAAKNKRPVVQCLHGWEYDTAEFSETIATKFDAVCDREWMVSTAQSAYFVSAVIGSLVFGWICDKWGRRPALLLSIAVLVIGNLAGIFLPNYSSYAIMKFIVGLSNPTVFNLSFLIPAEMIGMTKRMSSPTVCDIAYVVGMFILACVAHFVHQWQALQAAISVPLLLFIGFYWVVPESPRWLISQGRVDEAEVIIQKMAKVNGVPLTANILQKQSVRSSTVTQVERSSKEVGITQIWQYPRTALKLVNLTFLWAVTAMMSYGMSFVVAELPANTDVAFFLSGVFALPGVFCAWWSAERFGRKRAMFWSFFFSGVFATAEVYVPEEMPWLAVLLPSLAKFFSSVTYTVIYIYGGELLPTVIRGSGLGVATMGSQVGLVINPYIMFLGRLYGGRIPFAILGALGLLAALSVLMLPETLNVPLPDTLEESEHFSDFVKRKKVTKNELPVLE